MKPYSFLLLAVLAIIPSYTFAIPGDIDPTFGGGYHVTGIGQSASAAPFTQMVIQPSGKILVAANMNDPGAPQITLFRFNANGSPDMSFGTGGAFTIPVVGGAYNWSDTNKMVLQPDGKILVINGNNNGSTVFRINPNGGMDTSFAGTGQLTITGLFFASALRVLSDGKIVVAGSQGQPFPSMLGTWFVARYNSNGTPDSGFGSGGFSNAGSFDLIKYGLVGNVFIQPDGKVLVCGGYDVTKRYSVMRFNASGGLDSSFGTSGIAMMPPPSASDTAADVEMQSDGKIVFVGNRASGWGFRMGRMNTDGTPDTTFGTNGYVALTGPVISTFNVAVMAILGDGKILAGGYVTNAPDRVDFAVIKFNSDGSLDSARLAATGRSLKSKTGGFSLMPKESVLSS
ncbi:MAG TPA: hypothetical protein VGO50_11720 [Pyrinomonadaceae bacterium]|jgi:uncharacterized delta-60 repeat protein|nr:hypothetical protein [Pyrinomonadaceae bacterium]